MSDFARYIDHLSFEERKVKGVRFKRGIESRPLWAQIEILPLDDAIRWMDRFSVGESLFAEWAFALAVEKVENIRVPERAEHLRVILAELQRCLWGFSYLAKIFDELGEDLRRELCWNCVEELFNSQETLMGGRALPHGFQIGGVRRDLSIGELAKIRQLVDFLSQRDRQVFIDFSRELTINERLREGLKINRFETSKWALTGPISQSAGEGADLRIRQPYGLYGQLPVKVYHPEEESMGSAWARLQAVRFQIGQSLGLVRGLLQNLPSGAVRAVDAHRAQISGKSSLSVVEAPSGALHCAISSGQVRLSSYSMRLSPHLERLLLGLFCDDVALSYTSLGFDFAQGDLSDSKTVLRA